MVRPRRRCTLGKSVQKVSRRRHNSKKITINDLTLKKNWNIKDAVGKNYSALDLSLRVNQDIGLASTREKLQDILERKKDFASKSDNSVLNQDEKFYEEVAVLFGPKTLSPHPAVEELESRIQITRVDRRKVSPFQKKYIEKLSNRHGKDF